MFVLFTPRFLILSGPSVSIPIFSWDIRYFGPAKYLVDIVVLSLALS